jgi:hypothetical protein
MALALGAVAPGRQWLKPVPGKPSEEGWSCMARLSGPALKRPGCYVNVKRSLRFPAYTLSFLPSLGRRQAVS